MVLTLGKLINAEWQSDQALVWKLYQPIVFLPLTWPRAPTRGRTASTTASAPSDRPTGRPRAVAEATCAPSAGRLQNYIALTYKRRAGLQWHCAECATSSRSGVSELRLTASPRGQREPLVTPPFEPGRWSSSWTPPACTRSVCEHPFCSTWREGLRRVLRSDWLNEISWRWKLSWTRLASTRSECTPPRPRGLPVRAELSSLSSN